MKKILLLALLGLSTFAVSAHAQILGISIGRHGVGLGVGVPLYTPPPAVVYSPAPAYCPAPVYSSPYYAPPAYYAPAPAYCPAPAVVYGGPSVVIGAYPRWGWGGYWHHYGYGWHRGGWHR